MKVKKVAASVFVAIALPVPAAMRYVSAADAPIKVVEQMTRFEFVINLKTAKMLGITIPQPVLLRADEILQ